MLFQLQQLEETKTNFFFFNNTVWLWGGEDEQSKRGTCEHLDFLEQGCVSVSEVAQSRPPLCSPVDCSPPGSSIRGVFQARILEWGAISSSRESSQIRVYKNSIVPPTLSQNYVKFFLKDTHKRNYVACCDMWIMHFKKLLFIEDFLTYMKQILQKVTNCEI